MTVFGTYEWAVKNYNIVSGCSHNCKYCYSREMAIRFKRKSTDTWKNEEKLKSNGNLRIGKVKGQVMFPSSHDITPENLQLSIDVINSILTKENNLLIVSKPHLICISNICEEFHHYKKNILFRFSIGSSNNSILNFWESNAPSFEERFNSLKYAYNLGYRTSVSCEPMLDNNISDVVERVLPYVTDSVWIGKMNFLFRRLKMNGYTDHKSISMANQLLEWQNDEKIYALYHRYKHNSLIKWKESIKKVLNLKISNIKGLDN